MPKSNQSFKNTEFFENYSHTEIHLIEEIYETTYKRV